MVMPTLLVKGSLNPTSNKVKKEELDKFIAIHWILNLLAHKWSKESPNMNDRVLLLKSLVGSGKTTAFIVEVFRRFFNTHKFPGEYKFKDPIDFDFTIFDYPDDEYTIKNRQKGIVPVTKTSHKILCSQPKVLLAKDKAIEIATEPFNPDLELNENVGYTSSVFKAHPTDNDSIIYCTMGSLTTMFKNKTDAEFMQSYEMIAVDECHERSLELDEGCTYIRDFMRRNAGNKSCPMFVFMSATFDIDKYADYLGVDRTNSVLVEGGEASRDFFYLDYEPINVYQATADTVLKLHTENASDPETHNDILIFCPGMSQIKKITKAIVALDKDKEFYLTTMTSEIYNKNGPEMDNLRIPLSELREQLKIPTIKRRITIATPVVETGLTLATLKYVIDTCMVNATAYSPVHGLTSLINQACSLASMEQRGGRAGRVQYGYIYRMMQESLLGKMEKYSRPDIFTSDLSKIVLDMMYAGLDIEQVIKPMSNETFNLFIKDCTDVTGHKLTNKTENCKCIYIDSMNKKSVIEKEKTFVNEITLKNYPQQMLDNMPADVYVIARNKLISLGFYGTYIGYLASKISRLSVESIRMVMAGLAYGVNINDLITIGIFVDAGKKSYMYEKFMIKNMKEKIKPNDFRSDRLLESIIRPTTLKKHFGGDSKFLIDQLYDEFLEPLFIMRWYAKNVRKFGPMGVIDEAKKMGLDFRTIYKFMDCRSEIQNSFTKVGIVSTRPEVDFNSDEIFEDIIRIKKCVHAGFKNNLAYLTEDGFRYKTNSGLIITPKNMVVKFKPKKIVYGTLHMKVSNQPKYYEANPIFVCSLDGVI